MILDDLQERRAPFSAIGFLDRFKAGDIPISKKGIAYSIECLSFQEPSKFSSAYKGSSKADILLRQAPDEDAE